MERLHDEQKMRAIRSNLEKYRAYFKGPSSVVLSKNKLIHQDHFTINENIKITMFAFEQPEIENELQILINKIVIGEN